MSFTQPPKQKSNYRKFPFLESKFGKPAGFNAAASWPQRVTSWPFKHAAQWARSLHLPSCVSFKLDGRLSEISDSEQLAQWANLTLKGRT